MQEISAAQLKQRIETGEPLQLIDVREPFEWHEANLGSHGARLIPLDELPDRMSELDPDLDVVLYCRSGNRSGGAARYLAALGFERVWNLRGGIEAWQAETE